MILFQLLFEVADDQRAAFEQTYKQVFEAALRKQAGFQSARLIRFYKRFGFVEDKADHFDFTTLRGMNRKLVR